MGSSKISFNLFQHFGQLYLTYKYEQMSLVYRRYSAAWQTYVTEPSAGSNLNHRFKDKDEGRI